MPPRRARVHEGQVRAILGRHAHLRGQPGRLTPPRSAGGSLASPAASLATGVPTTGSLAPGPPATDVLPAGVEDPNALHPVAMLHAELAVLTPEQQRRLAEDYVALWARTFRTLVTHLRGRPERALALFADEVYPFLRGDRLAARVHAVAPNRARLDLAEGLPDPYVCGLVAAFVGLSGAAAHCRRLAAGRFEVTYRIAPADRLARTVQHAATLRLGLVLAALLAAATGVALAAARSEIPVGRVLVVLLGVAAAQLAANALHALRAPHPAGPLTPLRASRTALKAQLAGAALAALAAAAWLSLTGTPLVLLFAAVGVLLGLLYAPLRDHGLGPLVLVGLYGPLIAQGALHALDATASHATHLALVPWTLVPGALAAAALYVDDLAEAPLDEAGGKRTLAVRLPRGRQAAAYAALVAVGLVPLALLALRPWSPAPAALPVAGVALLALAAAALSLRVRSNLEDPRRLAPARAGTQALHVAATLLLLTLVRGLP